jgi:hypothetical protein
MRRRALLQTLAITGTAGIAGCTTDDSDISPGSGNGEPSSTDSPSETPTESPSDSPTDSSHEGLQRTVSLASVDAIPGRFEVDMDVELLRSRVTDAETARLRITTTNTGSPRSISVAEEMCSLLNRSKGGSDQPAGLWLHDPEQAADIDRAGNRWEADRSPDERRAYAAYGCTMKEYAPGESVSNEYALWDDYRVEGYMEPGTYRWEAEVSVSEGETPTGTTSEDTFTWGFSLAVSEP